MEYYTRNCSVPWIAMSSFAVSSSESMSIVLPAAVIGTFVISTLSLVFVTSTMNHMIYFPIKLHAL